MTTIIERDVSGGDGGILSALTSIIAIVAILIVTGIALYVLRVYPFNTQPLADKTTPTVNVNVTGSLPGTNTPSGQ
jgi:hypothetical protein